jgi:hypothetical protein
MKKLLAIVIAMFFGLTVMGYSAQQTKKESKPVKKVEEKKKDDKKKEVKKKDEKKKDDKKGIKAKDQKKK